MVTVDANAYTTTDGTNEGVIPLSYKTDSIQEQLYLADIFRDIADDVSYMLEGQAGKSITLFSDDEHWAVSGIGEGNEIAISELSYGNKALEINWYGDAKEYTTQSEVTNFKFTLNNFRGKALSAIGENRSSIILTELYNTTSEAIYPLNDAGTAYTSADMDSDAKIQTRQLVVADEKIGETLKQNIAAEDVVVHPRQFATLKLDPKVQSLDYNPQGTFIKGILQTLDGLRIRKHGAIGTLTENSKTVYVGLVLMPKPFYWATKVSPSFKIGDRQTNILSTMFVYYEAFGVKLKRSEGIIPVKSVGEY
jgi:hypothetical protein